MQECKGKYLTQYPCLPFLHARHFYICPCLCLIIMQSLRSLTLKGNFTEQLSNVKETKILWGEDADDVEQGRQTHSTECEWREQEGDELCVCMCVCVCASIYLHIDISIHLYTYISMYRYRYLKPRSTQSPSPSCATVTSSTCILIYPFSIFCTPFWYVFDILILYYFL